MRLTKDNGRKLSNADAWLMAADFIFKLSNAGLIGNGTVAGSTRRGVPIVNDLDLVLIPTSDDAWHTIKALLGPDAGGGASKVWGLLDGVYVDVLFTTEESYGAALMHSTGPKELNIRQRARAQNQGMILNESGLWLDPPHEEPPTPEGQKPKTKKLLAEEAKARRIMVAGEYEHDIYNRLSLPYLEPKDRK